MIATDYPASKSISNLFTDAEAPPKRPLQLLFIHHSCGGQWLAAQGPENGTNAIYITHPNGGNLRARLEQENYLVHEASYGSRIGENTDIFDWLPKFRTNLQQVLACEFQDRQFSNGLRNEIVIFKSCFPNNAFISEGVAPGIPSVPELTVWNAKATYKELLPEFQKCPDVLFVCITAPPLAPKIHSQPLWRRLLNKFEGGGFDLEKSGVLAREFNHWLASPDGWLKNSGTTNVVVFDYYDILTGYGQSNYSIYATGDGYDAHPGHAGNEKAAEAFVPFLNRAVHRIGMDK